ncbi:sugar transferase [bacterium]|nr:sugar transferase [bacterium]
MTKRFFDIIMGFFLLVVFMLPMMLVALAVKLTSKGPAIYWSQRIGRYSHLFKMPKFRTMYLGTPALAPHLLSNPNTYITSIGKFLRKTSLDELPQLFSILKGDMSLVGPRPPLFNEEELIMLRKKAGVDQILPGLTGWAQINGRDNLSPMQKVKLDEEYLHKRSFLFDIKILFITLFKVLHGTGISH